MSPTDRKKAAEVLVPPRTLSLEALCAYTTIAPASPARAVTAAGPWLRADEAPTSARPPTSRDDRAGEVVAAQADRQPRAAKTCTGGREEVVAEGHQQGDHARDGGHHAPRQRKGAHVAGGRAARSHGIDGQHPAGSAEQQHHVDADHQPVRPRPLTRGLRHREPDR
ncbi:MAG: hypothetical protein L0H31_02405 [Nocardioidaceae bacterium]|nr:hypothetical protein [Nocardioidaceae bacterium]